MILLCRESFVAGAREFLIFFESLRHFYSTLNTVVLDTVLYILT